MKTKRRQATFKYKTSVSHKHKKRRLSTKRRKKVKRRRNTKRKQRGGVNKQDILIDTMCYDLDETEIKDTKIYKLIKGLCNTRYVPHSSLEEVESSSKKKAGIFSKLLSSTGSLITMPASIAINTMSRITGIGSDKTTQEDSEEIKELKKLQDINEKLKENNNK